MAVVRSVMALLGRRARGFSGSSAAESMGGPALEIPQVVRTAASRTPPLRPAAPRAPGTPPLRPAAIGNLQSWQRFSTEGRNEADSVLHMLGQWSKGCVRNVRKAASAKSLFVCTMIVNVASTSFVLTNIRSLKQSRYADGQGKH